MGSSGNAFSRLLETLPEDQEFEFKGPVRKAFAELAEKVPKLKDSVLAQSDYSRKMDEHRAEVEFAGKMKDWRDTNWDEEHNMTVMEYQRSQELVTAQAELEAARAAILAKGDEMTFEQLNARLEQRDKEKGVVTAESLKTSFVDKTKEFENYLKGYVSPVARAAIDVPYIMAKHQKEFGEVLDPDDLIKYAEDKGKINEPLRDVYEKDWVVERRTNKMKEEYEAKLAKVTSDKDVEVAAAKAAAEAEGRKAAVMGQMTGNPVDTGGPDLGPLQRQMQQTQEQQVEGQAPKAPNVPIGDGGLAAFAAREFLAKQAGRTA